MGSSRRRACCRDPRADKKLAATTAAAPIGATSGCSWNPFSGNSCESQGLGGIGNKASDLAGGVGNAVSNPGGTWADTGGGIVNTGATWITNHPSEFVGLVTAAIVLTAACIAFCLEAGAAAGTVLAADSLVDAVAACTVACVGAAYNLGIPVIGMGGAIWNAANAGNPNAEVDLGGLPNSVTDPYASDVDNPSGWSGQLRGGGGQFVQYKTPAWKP